MATVQAEWLPGLIGFDHPATWIIALLIGIGIGVVIGSFHGIIIAFLGVPAFIVTLGGLLVWRGAAWWVTSGRTVAPMDSTFRLMGGGVEGAIGATASWAVGAIACVSIILILLQSRRQRKRFLFPLPHFLAVLHCLKYCFVLPIWFHLRSNPQTSFSRSNFSVSSLISSSRCSISFGSISSKHSPKSPFADV